MQKLISKLNLILGKCNALIPVAQAGKDVSYFGIILVVSVSIADHVGTYLNEYAKKPKVCVFL